MNLIQQLQKKPKPTLSHIESFEDFTAIIDGEGQDYIKMEKRGVRRDESPIGWERSHTRPRKCSFARRTRKKPPETLPRESETIFRSGTDGREVFKSGEISRERSRLVEFVPKRRRRRKRKRKRRKKRWRI